MFVNSNNKISIIFLGKNMHLKKKIQGKKKLIKSLAIMILEYIIYWIESVREKKEKYRVQANINIIWFGGLIYGKNF